MQNKLFNDKEKLLDFIGNNNFYYRRAYGRIVENRKNYWNLSAGLFGLFWLIYRRMYLYSIIYVWAFSEIISFRSNIFSALSIYEERYNSLSWLHLAKPATAIGLFILQFTILGFYGNKIYFRWISNNTKKNLSSYLKKTDILSVFIVILMPIVFLYLSIYFKRYYDLTPYSLILFFIFFEKKLLISIYLFVRHIYISHRQVNLS